MEVRSGCGDVAAAAQEEVASEGTFLVQVVVVHGGGADEEGILHSGRMSGASACAWLVGDEDILPCSPYPFSQEAVGTTVISQILHWGTNYHETMVGERQGAIEYCFRGQAALLLLYFVSFDFLSGICLHLGICSGNG